MKWSDLAGVVSKFAPVIGTAIGGPPGALVGSLIATALGVEDSPEAVAKELKHNPEAYVKLKKLESDERLKFQEYANDALATELADKKSARDSHKDSVMPAVICTGLTIMVCFAGYMIFTSAIPEDNINMANILFGALVAKWGDTIAYWVGTTRSSAQKTAMIGKG